MIAPIHRSTVIPALLLTCFISTFLPNTEGLLADGWIRSTYGEIQKRGYGVSMLSSSEDKNNEGEDSKHPMATTSRLSHTMLKVPSVDKTVKYWTDKGGVVCASREKPDSTNGDKELLSAFVELGFHKHKYVENDDVDPTCFRLELVATDKKDYDIGNSIAYVGVSLLLQFKDDLLGPFRGEKPQPEGSEPNDIPVKSSASAPGDYLSRFALKSRDLLATHDFYKSVLGMEAMAVDADMVCLRYENESMSQGVPTTLVFEATDEELIAGDCFDHLAIATKTDVDILYETLVDEKCKIFMKPTDMFGKRIIGAIDPNGYKVVIASD